MNISGKDINCNREDPSNCFFFFLYYYYFWPICVIITLNALHCNHKLSYVLEVQWDRIQYLNWLFLKLWCQFVFKYKFVPVYPFDAFSSLFLHNRLYSDPRMSENKNSLKNFQKTWGIYFQEICIEKSSQIKVHQKISQRR